MSIAGASLKTPTPRSGKALSWWEWGGLFFLSAGSIILYLTFAPALEEEIKYRFRSESAVLPVLTQGEAKEKALSETEVLIPIDEAFGIVIPKIHANAKVVEGVNWQDSTLYQRALTQGVAHAEGTALPGEEGNVFIFAHSGVDFYEAARYNAVFYLLNKLEAKDRVYLFYQGKKYEYEVVEKRRVSAEAVEYLETMPGKKTLTLMTCWPPGTTLKRLIVQANEVIQF